MHQKRKLWKRPNYSRQAAWHTVSHVLQVLVSAGVNLVPNTQMAVACNVRQVIHPVCRSGH